MYDVLNDATVTLTVAASNPTNPRIDLVYIQVQDSFYSGSADQAIAGVVTGTAAASPAVPATPANAIAIATVAVGAGVTSIVNANIARVVAQARVIGGIQSVADLTALAALSGAVDPDEAYVDALNALFIYDSGAWVQQGIATVANAATRDTEYAKAAGAYRINGATVYLLDLKVTQVFNSSVWRGIGGMAAILPTSAVNGSITAGGRVIFSAVTTLSINGCFTTEYDNYLVIFDASTATASANVQFRARVGGVDLSTGTYFQAYMQLASVTPNYAYSTTATAINIGNVNTSVAARLNLDVHGPMLAGRTAVWFTGNDTSAVHSGGSGAVLNNTLYDGFTLFPTSGTMTGIVRIYGWNNN